MKRLTKHRLLAIAIELPLYAGLIYITQMNGWGILVFSLINGITFWDASKRTVLEIESGKRKLTLVLNDEPT